ncbi:MAG: PAS domain S-box protein [Pedobacter sp.]|nr:PAS domain S-box protein [Pedobacter sp.]
MTNNPEFSQQRFLKMFYEIEDYAIVLLDEKGNVENWNKGAEKIKGYAADEILGVNFEEFYTPEDREAQLPARLIKEATINSKVSHEGWRVRKDGSRFWVSILITAIHDDNSNVIGFTKILRDRTAAKLAEDQLKNYEDRHSKMILEISDYAIILLDLDGNIENWNRGAEKIKGYTPDEIIGKNFRIFYSAEDQAAQLPESLINVATNEGRAQAEGWRIRKDGSRFWGLITITALHDSSGHTIGFSKVTRDLTDKLIAEQAQLQHIAELDRKNKELEQFTYIASHDLQEPLRTISSFNALLKESYGNQMDQDAVLFLDIIDQAASRMTNLIHGLLDYSRIGVKKTVVAINCNQVLADIEIDLFQLIEETGTIITPTELPVIRGYHTEITQLFQNIISNAIKYRSKLRKPVIEISCKEDDKEWIIKISDNGIGMEPKYIHKIFLIFQRLHNRDEYQGNGIGLANCKKICELHKGDIWVKSVPGEGSQFYFSISKHI